MWFPLLAKPVMTWYSQVTDFLEVVSVLHNDCFSRICKVMFFLYSSLFRFHTKSQSCSIHHDRFQYQFSTELLREVSKVSLHGRVILISSGCTTIVNYDVDRTLSFAVGAKLGNPNPSTEIDCHQFKQRARKSDV